MTTTTSVQISPVDIAKRQKLGLRSGSTVRVWQKIQEKGKTRLQAFEGLVIATKHGHEAGATFTVRKTASGVGMEKIFPLYSPNIDKIEIIRQAKVGRSKLYYIRDKAAREIRRRMKRVGSFFFAPEEVAETVVETPVVAEETTLAQTPAVEAEIVEESKA